MLGGDKQGGSTTGAYHIQLVVCGIVLIAVIELPAHLDIIKTAVQKGTIVQIVLQHLSAELEGIQDIPGAEAERGRCTNIPACTDTGEITDRDMSETIDKLLAMDAQSRQLVRDLIDRLSN